MDLAIVARTVSRREVEAEPKARESPDTEWYKLRNIGGEKGVSAWNEYGVKEWHKVNGECKGLNQLHIGSLHELCVEQGSELEKMI